MGCWCGTCAITHLPINAGDKIRLFFMTMQDYGNEKEGAGFCYSNDCWYPRGLPISGEYDDYGGIENIEEDILCKILVDGINKDWAPYQAEHEWEKSTAGGNLTIQEIVEETERDRATIHDGQSPTEHDRFVASMNAMKEGKFDPIDDSAHPEDRPTRPFGFIMVHEHVYQAMLKYDPVDAHHTDKGYTYKKRSEILAADMEEFYLAGLKSVQELKDVNPKLQKLLLSTGTSHWNVFNHTAMNSDPPFCKGMSYYWDFLREKMSQGVPYEDPEVQAVAKGIVDFQKFAWAMSAARRAWMPQCGKGSQQNDLDVYLAIDAGAKKVMRDRIKEMEADGFDLPDKDGFKPYMIQHNQELKKKGKNAKKGK